MIDALRQDLAHALSRLRRSPGFALVAVATLAIGIGATSAIFSVVDAVLLRPLAYRDPGGLVALFAHETKQGERRNPTSPADFAGVEEREPPSLEAHRRAPVVARAHRTRPRRGAAGAQGHARALRPARRPARCWAGSFHGPEDEHQVVLGHALWQRRFGGDPASSASPSFSTGSSYVVAGVMPPGFRFPPFWATGAEMWVPLVFSAEHAGEPRALPARLRPAAPGRHARRGAGRDGRVGARLARRVARDERRRSASTSRRSRSRW